MLELLAVTSEQLFGANCTYFYLDKIRIVDMAESDWDTVTVLRKKGSAAQSKSKQVANS